MIVSMLNPSHISYFHFTSALLLFSVPSQVNLFADESDLWTDIENFTIISIAGMWSQILREFGTPRTCDVVLLEIWLLVAFNFAMSLASIV